MRRGIAELDGEGEVVGGVVVMRWGENALTTIDAVKARLAELSRSLPEGVEIVATYDRSSLIKRAVETLQRKLVEEFLVVALVCAAFLFHLPTADFPIGAAALLSGAALIGARLGGVWASRHANPKIIRVLVAVVIIGIAIRVGAEGMVALLN